MLEIDELYRVRPGESSVHYWDNQLFPRLKAQKCIDDLAGLMHEVYENYSEAKERNQNLQKLLLETLTWDHATQTAIERLKEIKVKL